MTEQEQEQALSKINECPVAITIVDNNDNRIIQRFPNQKFFQIRSNNPVVRFGDPIPHLQANRWKNKRDDQLVTEGKLNRQRKRKKGEDGPNEIKLIDAMADVSHFQVDKVHHQHWILVKPFSLHVELYGLLHTYIYTQ